MIYILVIWTTIAADKYRTFNDWRPIGEFYHESVSIGKGLSPKEMCEEAARQLSLKRGSYRCIRSK
jgi:hypothetical protein